MNIPVKIPTDSQADELDRRADEALARFRAQWPPERCKRLGDAIIGTPAEKAAANASYVADALARVSAEAPAEKAVIGLLSDAELLGLAKVQRKHAREERRAGGL